MQEVGPIGRRFFINTRLNVSVSDSDSLSAVEAQTIRVNDQFTSGGAQQAGGRHGKAFNAGVGPRLHPQGIHSVRAGVNLDGGWYRSDNTANYLGTYVFSNDTDFQNGHAISYTQRIGDPAVSYFNMNSGVYLQDDIRVRKNLTLSPGVRYETQTHFQGQQRHRPALRRHLGAVQERPDDASGERRHLLRLADPRHLRTDAARGRVPPAGDQHHQPDVSKREDLASGVIPPTNKYVLSPDLHFMHYRRVSAGIDQQISPKLRISTTYSYTLGDGLWRGKDLNAPVNGVRPDPAFADIVQVTPDAGSHQHQLQTNFQMNLAGNAQQPVPGSGPRFNWRRLSMNGSYTLGTFTNNTDNRFALPPTGDPNLEWGPAPGDVRHRFNAGINSSQIRNFNANLNINASSGQPYSIQTGFDDNGDGTFNDRPAGVGRNTERTSGQWTLNGNFRLHVRVRPGDRRRAAGRGHQLRPGRRAARDHDIRRRRAAALPPDDHLSDFEHHEPRQLRRLQRRADVALLRTTDARAEPAENRRRLLAQFLAST